MTSLTPITLARMADPDHGAELSAFCDSLSREHYATLVIDQHILQLSRALPRMRGTSHSRGDVLRAFGLPPKPARKDRDPAATVTAYCRFLAAEGRLAPTPDRGRDACLRSDYDRFLLEMRGLSLSSRQHHASVVLDLLYRGLRPGQPLRDLTAAQVDRFVLLRSREISRHSLQHDVAYIRAFLRFCFDQGLISRRLDQVDNVKIYRGELPPRAMPWCDILKLLAAVDRRCPRGERDYAILHLMAHYGLRPSEVAALRVDSIDWDRGLLDVFQPKTGSRLLLPLAKQTIQVLRRYIARCRGVVEDPCPQLFLGAVNPVGPITRYTVGDIFDLRAQAAGFELRRFCPYSLRHGFAMRLLARGVGVKAIGDVLGHRSIETTCTYLRLDADVLRSVALELPVAGFSEVRHG